MGNQTESHTPSAEYPCIAGIVLIQDSFINLEVSWVAVVFHRPRQALIWAETLQLMCKRWYNPGEKNNAFLHLKLSSHLSFYCSYLSFAVADFFLLWFGLGFFIWDWDTGAIGAIKMRKEQLVACKPLPNTGRCWCGPEWHSTEELKAAGQGSLDQISICEAVPLDTAWSDKMGEGLSLKKSAVTE